MTHPAVGAPAPLFTLQNQDEQAVSLSDLRGKKVLLFFYPKALTPGCTTQACALSDGIDCLAKHNVSVFGISPDNPALLQKFKDKHNLKVPLLSDPSTETLQNYGVWAEKSMYGRKYMGVLRTTFLINEDGTVEHVWEKVSPKTHLDNVLKYLES